MKWQWQHRSAKNSKKFLAKQNLQIQSTCLKWVGNVQRMQTKCQKMSQMEP